MELISGHALQETNKRENVAVARYRYQHGKHGSFQEILQPCKKIFISSPSFRHSVESDLVSLPENQAWAQ